MKKILLKTDQNNPAIKEYKKAMDKGKLLFDLIEQMPKWYKVSKDGVKKTFWVTRASKWMKKYFKAEIDCIFIKNTDDMGMMDYDGIVEDFIKYREKL